MARRPGTTFTLLTLHIYGICVHASSGENVNCWWNNIVSVGQNVSIHCQADPQSPMLKCRQCHLHVKMPERTAEARLHECTRLSANFTVLVKLGELQAAECLLTCPAKCSIKQGFLPPTCIIPWDDGEHNIHCHWTWTPSRTDTTYFTLHWMEDKDSINSITVEDRDSAIIQRSMYSSHHPITVWLTVENMQGSLQSDRVTYDTAKIVQFEAPLNLNHTFDPLEISWQFLSENFGEPQQCEVQYREDCDPDWTEVEEVCDQSFSLDGALPFTNYTFRVRCGYGPVEERVVMSEWSSLHTVRTPAAAPDGQLDVWSDCELNSEIQNCRILWKPMPKVKARGQINSYVVAVKLRNGSELEAPSSLSSCLNCEDGLGPSLMASAERKCEQEAEQHCFHYSEQQVDIREVQGVCVRASTSAGESSPMLVPLPRTAVSVGAQTPDVQMKIKGTSGKLNISWSVPPFFSERVQEYVVQLKSMGSNETQCLNWVKLSNTQNSVTLTGGLKNYTAYNVSLFAVISNFSQLLHSAVAYTVEGVPPKMTSLHVTHETASSVKLTWPPVPPDKSRGVILHYFVGLSNHETMYRVSRNSTSLLVSDLSPGQQYELWVSAVTSAGEGNRTTTRFTTRTSDNDAAGIGLIVLTFVILLLITVFLFWLCTRPKVNECLFRIPDPLNSRLFQQKVDQFNHSWPDHRISTEATVMISPIEMFTVPDDPPEPEDTSEQLKLEQQQELPEENLEEQEEDRGKERRLSEPSEKVDSVVSDKRKDYSQMIDSTDEGDSMENEEEEWEMSAYPSDYEKHFWPPTEES